jgi:hypothetical protein
LGNKFSESATMFEWPMAGGECMFCEKDVFAITRKKKEKNQISRRISNADSFEE